jgi:hypothetical protein
MAFMQFLVAAISRQLHKMYAGTDFELEKKKS